MGISRNQLFAMLGVIKVIDPATEAAYRLLEERVWRENLDSSPHGQLWHTSFHASKFPGDDQMACGRAAIYGLMDVPSPAPVDTQLRALADAGKDIEKQIVSRWEKMGILVSAAPDAQRQTGFVDEDHWLTGNTDAVIVPPGWSRPHVVELKTKSNTRIEEMKLGLRGADPTHVNQILTYIGFAHELSGELWPHLDPVVDGSIYYVSRDNPRNTYEFFYRHDPNFMALGRARLKQWQQAFLDGHLPQRDQHWKWSELPCKYCSLKKHVCKPDWKNGVERLVDSAAIEFSQGVRPEYSYAEARERVLNRWRRATTDQEAA